MSLTLILWKGPLVDDADEAQDLLSTWYETGDDSAFEASGDLQKLHDELLRQYPMDPDTDSGPWADGPDNSGRLLVLSIRWSGDDRILADVVVLARKLGLLLYDPQGPDIFLPTDPIDELTAIPPFKPTDWLKIAAMIGVLAALTYAAWLIPIGWLRWTAVTVGAFVTSAAIFVLGAMLFAPRIMGANQSSNR